MQARLSCVSDRYSYHYERERFLLVLQLDVTNENRYRSRTVQERSQPAPGIFPAPEAPATASAGPRRVRSEELMGGSPELLIDHQGREYRLRVTQNGKLILTA